MCDVLGVQITSPPWKCFFVYSFVDENGEFYSGITELTINGNTVYAVNSPKVWVNYRANLL